MSRALKFGGYGMVRLPVSCRLLLMIFSLLSSFTLAASASTALFDKPVATEEVTLTPDPLDPDIKRKITCVHYADLMIKEVDYGEVGAQKLAVQPADSACTEEDKDERVIADLSGYYDGRKGDYLFFRAADGWNGGMPFYVYDAKTLKLLFEENFKGDGFEKLEQTDGGLTINYERTWQAPCSLYLDGGNCAQRIRAAVKGLGDVAALPDCGRSYDAEKKRTPDFAKDIEKLPSVIHHQAVLVFDGKSAVVTALPGETSCRVPD